MSRIIFVVFFLALCSHQTFSAIRDVSVDGASRYEYDGENIPTVWAGLGGTDPGTCDTTCDNCLGGGSRLDGGSRLQPCNENRIDVNGYLTISFRSDTATGVPIVTDSNEQTTIGRIMSNVPPVNVNEPTSVAVRWSDICAQVEGAGSCVGSGGVPIENSNFPIAIGIDSDNNGSLNDSGDDSLRVNIVIRSRLPDEGIETFALFPGDEKIFMLTPSDEQLIPGPDEPNIVFPPGFPSYGNNLITEIRFYYEEVLDGEDVGVALDRITNRSDYVKTDVTDIGQGGDVELSRLYFTESDGPSGREEIPFNNGSTYVFKIALVDEAGNIGLFNNTFDEGRHVVVPSRVRGLLNKSGFCFIVTAAYGDSHKILETFYQFRDQKLLPYALGRIIHDLYYTYSPPLADIIRDNIFLKYIARICLIPFWIYAFLALQVGHILTLFLLATSILVPLHFLIKKKAFRVLWLSR